MSTTEILSHPHVASTFGNSVGFRVYLKPNVVELYEGRVSLYAKTKAEAASLLK